MNERQQLAIKDPCARADETMSPLYFKDKWKGRILLSTALTVNR